MSVASRLYHSVSAFTLGPHCIWLVLFGGVSDIVDDKDWQDQSMLSNTAVIELGELTITKTPFSKVL